MDKGGAPRGELAVRTLAMPADTNPAGDIFGGWIMSLMDVAGGISAVTHAGGRVVTVAATDMAFLRPVKVGDVVCCYTDLARVGRTSLTPHESPHFYLLSYGRDSPAFRRPSASRTEGCRLWSRRRVRSGVWARFGISSAGCMGLTCMPSGSMRWRALRLG
jgi:hypothetical protein